MAVSSGGPAGDALDSASALEQALRAASEELDETNATIHEVEERERDRIIVDRSYLSYVVLGLYAATVTILFIFVIAYFPSVSCDSQDDCIARIEQWKEPADFLLRAITTTVLPVVTLVVGFYFGTRQRGKPTDR